MTRQYETCEHRHDTTNPDAFYVTPCRLCEYDRDSSMKAVVICLLAVALAVALVVWRLA